MRTHRRCKCVRLMQSLMVCYSAVAVVVMLLWPEIRPDINHLDRYFALLNWYWFSLSPSPCVIKYHIFYESGGGSCDLCDMRCDFFYEHTHTRRHTQWYNTDECWWAGGFILISILEVNYSAGNTHTLEHTRTQNPSSIFPPITWLRNIWSVPTSAASAVLLS